MNNLPKLGDVIYFIIDGNLEETKVISTRYLDNIPTECYSFRVEFTKEQVKKYDLQYERHCVDIKELDTIKKVSQRRHGLCYYPSLRAVFSTNKDVAISVWNVMIDEEISELMMKIDEWNSYRVNK